MNTTDPATESQIAQWRGYVARRSTLRTEDADELEDHLRGRIEDLVGSGLRPDEAFLVAVKRLGSLDALTREFAREHSDRLWKQLVLSGDPGEPGPGPRRSSILMIGCAIAAGLAIQVPRLFGLSIEDDHGFFVRNFGLFALVPLATYFAIDRGLRGRAVASLIVLFALAAAGANAFGLVTDGAAWVLTSLHLPIALWLVAGVAYADGDWRPSEHRMDFLRFTGEWFVYYVLIALGGGVLTGLVMGTFAAINVDASTFVGTWMLPSGAVGAVVVAAWLVEAKQAVIENIAPVLTWVFTPLFLLALSAFLLGAAVTANGLDIDRDVLILFDLVLVVVVGLLIYGISARDPGRGRNWFHVAQFGLVVVALAIDVLVLAALAGRISDFGFSANKAAALGENLILLANLGGSAWLLVRYLRRRASFTPLERWQTGFLTVYAAWAWVVVLVFPLVFGVD
jgi:hypothetical protein